MAFAIRIETKEVLMDLGLAPFTDHEIRRLFILTFFDNNTLHDSSCALNLRNVYFSFLHIGSLDG